MNYEEGLNRLRSALDAARVRAGMDGNRAAQRHFEERIAGLETTAWNEDTLWEYEEYLGQPGMRRFLEDK